MISSGGFDENHTMTPMLKKINTKAKDTSNLLHNLTVTSHIATHYGVLDHHHMSFEFKVKKNHATHGPLLLPTCSTNRRSLLAIELGRTGQRWWWYLGHDHWRQRRQC